MTLSLAAAAPSPDLQTEKAIRARFAASKISVNNFQVHVKGGVATIEGRTDVIQHKGAATRLAKSAGAKRVVNKVVVSQAARDRASVNLAKGRRRAQIKRGDARSTERSPRPSR
ncbi:MAG: BON domain-containing protein [Bryobacteraceae bacterium]